jgi:hypothetical protein
VGFIDSCRSANSSVFRIHPWPANSCYAKLLCTNPFNTVRNTFSMVGPTSDVLDPPPITSWAKAGATMVLLDPKVTTAATERPIQYHSYGRRHNEAFCSHSCAGGHSILKLGMAAAIVSSMGTRLARNCILSDVFAPTNHFISSLLLNCVMVVGWLMFQNERKGESGRQNET